MDTKGCGTFAEEGGHEYSEQTCPECGEVFCWNCCGNTNVHEGGKYDKDFMLCPKCGCDILSD